MDRKKFSILIFVFILAIFLINLVAHRFYWYFTIWWFDMLMHFVGGFWIGLAFLWMMSSKLFLKLWHFSFEPSMFFIFQVFSSVLLIGFFWELFEIFVNNIMAGQPFNLLDTSSDICFDLAGGVFAIFYFSKKVLLKIENKL